MLAKLALAVEKRTKSSSLSRNREGKTTHLLPAVKTRRAAEKALAETKSQSAKDSHSFCSFGLGDQIPDGILFSASDKIVCRL